MESMFAVSGSVLRHAVSCQILIVRLWVFKILSSLSAPGRSST
jgi:hypothetical protein